MITKKIILIITLAISILSVCILYGYINNNYSYDIELVSAYKHEQVVSNELVEYLIINRKVGTNITCNRWKEEASKIVLNEDNFGKKVRLTFETKITLQTINMDKYLIEAKLI